MSIDDKVSYAKKAELRLACLKISDQRCGAVALGIGSVVAVFGQKPPGDPTASTAGAKDELEIVRNGLLEAGAEEICGITFGGGYMLFVQPGSFPDQESGWAEQERLISFVQAMHELACRAHANQDELAGDASVPAAAVEGASDK